ncbi:MAG: hypothetical protein WBX08_21120, partial [Candidatus Sulfotelmatobacter sp.]
ALSGPIGPADLAVAFNPQAWESQFEAHPYALLLTQGSDGLYGNAITVEVADNPSIGGIEGNVGQGTQFMTVVGACVPRGK